MNCIWEVIFINDISDVVAQRILVSADCAEQAIEKVRRLNQGNKIVVISVVSMDFCDGRLVYKGGH